ncbi:hypothetical protein F511_34568 [Dorcoceras hygrometricum]|uniref:Uncharacterized protein n=1 Tax=Dorcoceras hygrometricum TaxID=472368 RepID=A0A2Z7B9B0_9LAMI|nr:hypothetical protein F511_34568 [Dorcoceras hygrometricum]
MVMSANSFCNSICPTALSTVTLRTVSVDSNFNSELIPLLFSTDMLTSALLIPASSNRYADFGLQCPTSPLLPPRKVPLEDLIYTSCTDPIPQPAAARTPRLHQPSAVTHLFYAYVRKATDTEFNVFVLGRDLICIWVLIHSLRNFAHLSKYLSPVDMLTSSLLLTDLALLIPDIYCSSSFFDISSSRLHRFCSRSHFRMRPVLFPPKRSNEQNSLYPSSALYKLTKLSAEASQYGQLLQLTTYLYPAQRNKNQNFEVGRRQPPWPHARAYKNAFQMFPCSKCGYFVSFYDMEVL